MKRRIKYLLCLLVGITFAAQPLAAQHSPQTWHETKSISGTFKPIASQPDIEVFSAPNEIIVKVNHQTEIRIFTILGKLVSSEHLQPGIFKYHLDSHGIYIIKTEESSCKIAI